MNRGARTWYARIVAAVAGLVNVGFGAWAFFAPRSFFTEIATFEPYNRHFLHDLGAFQVGIGAALLAALIWRDALTVALFGGAAGTAVHAVSHFLDGDLGGRGSDPWTLTVVAVLLVLGFALRAAAARGDRSAATGSLDEPAGRVQHGYR